MLFDEVTALPMVSEKHFLETAQELSNRNWLVFKYACLSFWLVFEVKWPSIFKEDRYFSFYYLGILVDRVNILLPECH